MQWYTPPMQVSVYLEGQVLPEPVQDEPLPLPLPPLVEVPPFLPEAYSYMRVLW